MFTDLKSSTEIEYQVGMREKTWTVFIMDIPFLQLQSDYFLQSKHQYCFLHGFVRKA
jgi:hypothetical protein